MSNEVLVSNLIAKSMSEFYVQKNPIFNTSNRKYVEQFSQQMYATGGTINIKVPNYPLVTRGLAVTPTGIQDLTIPFTITANDIYNVTRELSVYEEIFNIIGHGNALTKDQKEAIVDNYAYPAYEAIAGQIEAQAALDLDYTAYYSPIDGIEKLGAVNTYSAISQVDTMADVMKFAKERYLIMNPYDAQRVTDSLQNMFNPMINSNITKTARIGGTDKGRLAGFDVYRSTELQQHIAGPEAGNTGITVTSISADGTTLVLAGVAHLTNARILAGDRISIPSVNLVSNVTYNQSPYRFVGTASANANGDGAGNVTVVLSYPMLVSGEHQNVFTLPANGAPAAIFPSHNLNFAYVPSGISCCPVRLADIRGATNSTNAGDLKVPVHVYIQGAVSSFENVFRISNLTGIRAFAPYIIALPSSIS